MYKPTTPNIHLSVNKTYLTCLAKPSLVNRSASQSYKYHQSHTLAYPQLWKNPTTRSINSHCIHTSSRALSKAVSLDACIFDSFTANSELQTVYTNHRVHTKLPSFQVDDLDDIIAELSGKTLEKNVKVLNSSKKQKHTGQKKTTPHKQPPSEILSIESQKQWVSLCMKLMQVKDYENLKLELVKGSKLSYFIPIQDLSDLIIALNTADQRYISLAAFKLFENRAVTSLTTSSQQNMTKDFSFDVIESVIKNAYHSRDLRSCVSIYMAYFDRLPFSEELANSAIKSLYKMSMPLQAGQLLNKVKSQATEKIITSVIRGISAVTANSAEMANIFYDWRQNHTTITPELYATVLEQCLYLHDSSRFIEISGITRQDGYFDHPRVQEVMFQQLLHEKNPAQIQAFISMTQSNNKDKSEITQNPLNNAVSYFARQKDGPGVSMMIDLFTQLNLPYSHQVLNALLSLIISKGDPGYLVSYIEEFSEERFVGSNATINLIWKGMLKSYETEAVFVSKSLKELAAKCPRLSQGLSSDTFELARIYKYQKARVRRHTYVNNTKYEDSVLAALRQIETFNANNRPQNGIKVIENLKEQGIKPSIQLFNTLLTGICKCRLKSEFDIVLKMMENEGYKPSIDLEVVFLRTYLAGLSKANNFKSAIRTLALNKISGFVKQHRDALSRRAATSLGYEFLFWQDYEAAHQLFDFVRLNSNGDTTLSSSNHNTDSLAGLATTLYKLGRVEELDELCRQLVETNTRIIVKPLLLETLKKIAKERFLHYSSHRKGQDTNQKGKSETVNDPMQAAMSLINEIDVKSREYVKANLVADLEKLEKIFDKWERILEERENGNTE